jgi:hypothetical protein
MGRREGMNSEHSGSVDCILHLNNPRGLGGCCKAANLTWWLVAERSRTWVFGFLCPLACLPYSPDPWDALPLTWETKELRNRHFGYLC